MSPYFAYLSVDPDTKQVLNAHIKEAPLSFTGHPVKAVDPVVYKQGCRFIGTFTSIRAAENACANAFFNHTTEINGMTCWKDSPNRVVELVINYYQNKYNVLLKREDGSAHLYVDITPASISRLNTLVRTLKPVASDFNYWTGMYIRFAR